MNEYTLPIFYGVFVGVLARLFMLKTDYRQYPTYLHGKIIHIALGFIAAGLLSCIHNFDSTRLGTVTYAVFCV